MLRRTIAAIAICILFAPAAFAHAILIDSQPTSGASVSAGMVNMTFRYNSRIDRERSRLTLTKPDQTQVVLPIIPAGAPNILESDTTLTTPGAYVVRWQVLAIDGHITRGDVPFIVKGH